MRAAFQAIGPETLPSALRQQIVTTVNSRLHAFGYLRGVYSNKKFLLAAGPYGGLLDHWRDYADYYPVADLPRDSVQEVSYFMDWEDPELPYRLTEGEGSSTRYALAMHYDFGAPGTNPQLREIGHQAPGDPYAAAPHGQIHVRRAYDATRPLPYADLQLFQEQGIRSDLLNPGQELREPMIIGGKFGARDTFTYRNGQLLQFRSVDSAQGYDRDYTYGDDNWVDRVIQTERTSGRRDTSDHTYDAWGLYTGFRQYQGEQEMYATTFRHRWYQHPAGYVFVETSFPDGNGENFYRRFWFNPQGHWLQIEWRPFMPVTEQRQVLYR